MGIRLDKPKTPVTPKATTPQADSVFLEQQIEKRSVPISITLPSAQKPAERPNQPIKPTSGEPKQPASPPPTDSSE